MYTYCIVTHPQTMAGYDLLTMETVAKRLGVSLKTVYRWIDAGQMPVSQLGSRTYRMFESDFIRFIQTRVVKAKKPATAKRKVTTTKKRKR